jgi:hypothetical protein
MAFRQACQKLWTDRFFFENQNRLPKIGFVADVIFLEPPGFPTFALRLLVYLKSMYTSLVVVVNTGHFLWTSPYFSTESTDCTRYKPVRASVCGWYQIWTKIQV